MPELPEVEVVRAGLAPAVAGARIVAVEVRDERALTRHRGAVADFVRELEGARLSAALRRGKFLWLPLRARPRALLAHLGMSGQLLLRRPGSPTQRHERIRLSIDHPQNGGLAVIFADQRTFGSLAVDDLLEDGGEVPAGRGSALSALPSQVRHIGRDPLDPAFDDDMFLAAALRRQSGIKRILLDQGLLSGIGNIYADEALWAAGLHPDRPGRSIPAPRLRSLLEEVRLVLQRALAEGGTSFDAQYVNVNGQAGYFSRSLNAYGRADQACARCGSPIRRVKFMNRSSFFCPHCQRKRSS